MTKEQLADFGAQILAMDKITRWELDPKGNKYEDYFHEEIISLMWDIFDQELSKIGGLAHSNVVNLLDQALWQGVDKEVDYFKIINQAYSKKSSGHNCAGIALKDFYKPYIELLIDNAIKIGAIMKEKQDYFKKQG